MKPQRNYITSFSNPKVKWVSGLKEKRNRDEEKKFFIEGFREIKKAITGNQSSPIPCLPVNITSLFISPECFLGENEESLINSLRCPIYELPRKIFEKISYRDRPDGLIAVAETPSATVPWKEMKGIDINPILIIEGVEKPGNLGTILRTAEGAGVGLVIVTDPRIDLFNPNVVRASTGTIFTLPVYIGDLGDVLSEFQKRGYKRYAVTPEGKTLYSSIDMNAKSVFLFGSEQYGLSPLAKELADSTLYLPMLGEADSLNLAMSCGIVLYESIRQRSK
ncbi:RNA methyltransferase, TrmH family [Leptospira yanagawae serovar Saopaulo str. Sao Paulo = ATCC 700523]|uniref:RNA methyltransferase, TrmH family n=1 Tax=Leptospira yanagawae serovar Saopaulo str. Sao Paulo = ATCC 700523 TaxID=1249483 RepID=A0A5E8HIJ9_9LEPT|nr:RNA methyltransferase [Leptospira yanagawae]EOQ90320.1 RNA methyltransferase, TrmH family [Leptospira yanagawae serovar Saopaulo str. Sao Paulo = ATCC 700523]